MTKNRVIFYGTPGFSVPFLKALVESDEFEVVGVITEPDRPAGRGNKVRQSSVSEYMDSCLRRNDTKIFKPKKIIDIKSEIGNLKPDLAVVVAYGQIIPSIILNIPKYGSINVHPSDLPKYRGPSPIQSALLHGDKETAISVMKMDRKMDHGPILDKKLLKINENDDYFSLEKKILDAGPNFLAETLRKYIDKKIKSKKQNDSKATYCTMIDKEDGLIDWNKTSEEIHDKIRAYVAWPKAYTILTDGKRLIFLKSHVESGKIKPILVQLEGKKALSWEQFKNGYQKSLPNELTKRVV